MRACHQKPLRLFLAVGPLELLAMDVMRPLPGPQWGNQQVIVSTERYKKLTRAIKVSTTTSTTDATEFVHNWAIPHSIPTYLLTNNGRQFVSKFFAAVTVRLGIKHWTTTISHLQTGKKASEMVQQNNLRSPQELLGRASDRLGDKYVQLLTYVNNAQVQRSTGTTPLSRVLSHQKVG